MRAKSNISRWKIFLMLSAITGLLFSSHACFAENILRMGGVGSALGSMGILGAAFERSHPGTKVKIFPSMGSSGGIKAVADGTIDIGLSGRVMNDSENRGGLSMIEYAETPLIFVANKNVTVSTLTTEEIIKIYEGKNQLWPDGQLIRLILRPVSDTDITIIKKISPEMKKAVEAAFLREGMLTAMTDQENAEIIEKTPGAVGTSTLAQIVSEVHSLKILMYNGALPNSKNLALKSYPIFKPLFFITRQVPSAAVRQFIDFVRSDEGRKLLEVSGHLIVAGEQGNR